MRIKKNYLALLAITLAVIILCFMLHLLYFNFTILNGPRKE